MKDISIGKANGCQDLEHQVTVSMMDFTSAFFNLRTCNLSVVVVPWSFSKTFTSQPFHFSLSSTTDNKCSRNDQQIAQREYVTILCFDKNGNIAGGGDFPACGQDGTECPYYVLISIAEDADNVDLDGISLNDKNGYPVLFGYPNKTVDDSLNSFEIPLGTTAAVLASYEVPVDADIMKNFVPKSIDEYKQSGSLCGENGCGQSCSDCQGTVYVDFCYLCGGEFFTDRKWTYVHALFKCSCYHHSRDMDLSRGCFCKFPGYPYPGLV